MNIGIAFCGSKASGKSTSATILQELFKGPTEELAFASHLKKTSSEVFNVNMKYFLDPNLKETELESYVTLTPENLVNFYKGFEVAEFTYDNNIRPHIGQVFETGRQLLQYVGTEVLHPIDPLINAKMSLKNRDRNKLSIITDLRFLREYEFLKNENFVIVYVYNQSAESIASGDSHLSERDLVKFKDHCILLDNNGSLEQLKINLSTIVNNHLKEPSVISQQA